MRFDNYQTEGFHDEIFAADGIPRPEAQLLLETIQSLEEGQLLRCHAVPSACFYSWASPSMCTANRPERRESFPST